MNESSLFQSLWLMGYSDIAYTDGYMEPTTILLERIIRGKIQTTRIVTKSSFFLTLMSDRAMKGIWGCIRILHQRTRKVHISIIPLPFRFLRGTFQFSHHYYISNYAFLLLFCVNQMRLCCIWTHGLWFIPRHDWMLFCVNEMFLCRIWTNGLLFMPNHYWIPIRNLVPW